MIWQFFFGQQMGPDALPLFGLFGVVEAICWALLLALGIEWLVRRRGNLPRPGRSTLALIGAATVARLLVPFAPYNWYTSVQQLPGLPKVYTSESSYVPLPARLVGFDLGLGFDGMSALNLILGIASVVILWRAARYFALTPFGAWLLAFLVAITPTYVVLSGSEAPQITMLFLWGVAAVAFAAVRDERGGWRAHAVLLTAILCAAPIRLESWLVFPSFVLLVGGRPSDWRNLVSTWRRYRLLIIALLVGSAFSLGYRWEFLMDTASSRSAEDTVRSLLLYVPTGVIGLMSPSWVSFVPLLIVFPAVYELGACVRERDWSRLAANLFPATLFVAPFALRGRFVFELASASYYVIFLLLPLGICTRGLERLVAKFEAGQFLARRWKRVTVSVLALPALIFFFVLPYRFTYVFQDEFHFLSANLPADERVTIAVIWDTTQEAGNHDCCIEHPHALLVAKRPDVRWLRLTLDDLERAERGELEFDYYFPGTLTLLDTDGPECGYIGRFVSDERREEWRRDRAHLLQLRELDEAIRARYPLEEIASSRASVHVNPPIAAGTNGVMFGFPRDGVEFTFYRNHLAETSTAQPAVP